MHVNLVVLKKHQESNYVSNHYGDLPLSREVNNTQHMDYDGQVSKQGMRYTHIKLSIILPA